MAKVGEGFVLRRAKVSHFVRVCFASAVGPKLALTLCMASGTYHSNDSLQGVYLLVVEDEQDGQRLLAAILRYCGAYVKAAGSWKEALDHMENLLPDAIVIRVSNTDMFSLVGRIRMFPPDAGGTVPVVGVGREVGGTGAGLPGCDAYLVEPIDPWELCRVVGNLVTSVD